MPSTTLHSSLTGKPQAPSWARVPEWVWALAALHFTGTVGKEAQPALRTDLRVELAQRTGRRVARIGQHLAAVQARTL